jgi:hypothetical protein
VIPAHNVLGAPHTLHENSEGCWGHASRKGWMRLACEGVQCLQARVEPTGPHLPAPFAAPLRRELTAAAEVRPLLPTMPLVPHASLDLPSP